MFECRAQQNAINSRANRTVGWRYRAPIAHRFICLWLRHFHIFSASFSPLPIHTAYYEQWRPLVHTAQYIDSRRTLTDICQGGLCEWRTLRAHHQFVIQWNRSADARNVITIICWTSACDINWIQFKCVHSPATVHCAREYFRGSFDARTNDCGFIHWQRQIIWNYWKFEHFVGMRHEPHESHELYEVRAKYIWINAVTQSVALRWWCWWRCIVLIRKRKI